MGDIGETDGMGLVRIYYGFVASGIWEGDIDVASMILIVKGKIAIVAEMEVISLKEN